MSAELETIDCALMGVCAVVILDMMSHFKFILLCADDSIDSNMIYIQHLIKQYAENYHIRKIFYTIS